MICTNCGAKLMDTDQFCPKCGAKAIKDKRCPDCGTVLRDGTKFCHKCGRPIDDGASADKVSNETLDIPIVDIERNILSETAAEIKADHRKSAPRRTSSNGSVSAPVSSSKSTSSKSAASGDFAQKNKPIKNTPPKNASSKKARASYREEEDWDDEDDWDDEEEEGTDIITIMTAVVGCVLLVVVAVLGYHLYRQYMPRNYGNAAQQQEQQDDDVQEQQGQEMEDGWEYEPDEPEMSFDLTLTVTHNVNVRDNPSTSDSNILKVAQEGETYRCNGSVKGEWYEILLDDGTIGYVFYEYVTVE